MSRAQGHGELMLRRRATLCAALAICLYAPLASHAKPVDFSREVKPILARRCFSCHGPQTQEGGLRLDGREAAVAALESGLLAIVPGDSAGSELLARVTAEDESLRMPPEGKGLSGREVDVLRRWIDEGAAYQKHWAFVAPVKQEPPAIAGDLQSWVRTPIDAFVLAQLEANRLQPAPRADKRTLCRRAYFDLTGLPPTEEELAEFLSDESPDAWERLIDKLLASPHYGERWGRHWLDLVRFAETNSFERDGAKPNAWKYRDYVIRSFNDDKPYDQFVREQLAGDELDQVTRDSIIATGYYRLGIWDDEPADAVQSRSDELDDLIATTSQAFLGLTVGCARCHDHKIDPIPQRDYYGLAAFLADVTAYGDRGDQTGNNQWDLSSPEEAARRRALREQVELVEREKTSMEEVGVKRMEAPDQRRSETHEREALLSEKLQDYLNESERAQYQQTLGRLEAARRELQELGEPESALALAKCDAQPAPTHLNVRGNPHVPGDVVEPRFPQLFGAATPTIAAAPAGARSAGRRKVLADWIASKDNLLTSRVIANRIWQHHFGRGIVRSANNFGELGDAPTHPELLDWLAVWLTEHDWKLKPLHRLIMTSSAYQMSSQADEGALAVDPLNDHLWRFDMRRLGAEELRDATLAASGRLNRALYGPSFYPQMSEEVLATQSMPGNGWGQSTAEEQSRRSVYVFVKRSLLTPLLTAFDFPDVDASCEARFNTTQPGQALSLLNGEFANEQARHLAERVRAEAGDQPREQVARAIEITLGRPATEAEIADGLGLMQQLAEEHGREPQEALRYWCLVALNQNEFLYLD
ncbi:Planctomycete cytochrome C [Lacipirellula limnantheis]|uniref:Planctomycete cytochrome C n=1 Tax=Lacipirellula limnantheis TaxID=2528024 RepID=A0A517U1G3_9BACT|nr:Planctomycete cytochrome C [Lacipirellula limnantheis]